MKTIPSYRGYEARVEFDAEARLLHGHVLGTRDVITFQSDALENVEHEFHASVDDYLVFCRERGESPDKPYSGRIAFRTQPDVHRRIAYAAARESGCSLSQWIEQACVNRLESERAAAQANGRNSSQPRRRAPASAAA